MSQTIFCLLNWFEFDYHFFMGTHSGIRCDSQTNSIFVSLFIEICEMIYDFFKLPSSCSCNFLVWRLRVAFSKSHLILSFCKEFIPFLTKLFSRDNNFVGFMFFNYFLSISCNEYVVRHHFMKKLWSTCFLKI